MKKVLFTSFCILFLHQLSHSQITINAEDIAPIGVVAEQTLDTEPDISIQPGDTGMQSWDFSALENEETGTFVFVNPEDTPYWDQFPDANLASLLDSSTYFYLNKTDERIEILGIYGEFEYQGVILDVDVNVEPPQSLIRFPSMMGNMYAEEVDQIVTVEGSTIGAPFDSVRTVNNLKVEVNIDAFGEMTTPAGTFETIRSNEKEVSFVDTYIYDNGWILVNTSDPDTVLRYNWWTNENGLGFPVVQLDISTTDNSREATWLTEFVVSAHEVVYRQFNLYPNPASERILLDFQDFFEGTYQILDIKGVQIRNGIISGQQGQIELSGLTAGPYLLLLKDETGNTAGFKQFTVHK